MAQSQGPAIGTVEDGYRFKGGNPANADSWEQVEPIDVSDRWGSGARQLPNGVIERVGPRGGVTVVANTAEGDADGVGKLTEGQGKAMLYGGMMAGAERDYQAARQTGYDPASFRNQAARVAGAVPFDGDFFGRLIRDDVSDAGNQAELRWAEGNLRQLTGAAATNPEIARVAAINFDRGNDELAAQRYRSRAETYQGTRYAAGPGASVLPDYPGASAAAGPEENGLPTYPGIAAQVGGMNGGQGPTDLPPPQGPQGGEPVDIAGMSANDLLALQPGQRVRFPDGRVETLSGAPRVGAQGQEVSPGVFAEQQTPEQTVAERRDMNGIARRIDAGVRGAADTLTFGLADEITAGLNTIAPLDPGTRSGFQDGFGAAYRNNVAQARAIDQADAKDVPVSRGAGQVAGALAPGAILARGAGMAAARPIGQQMARGAAAGAAYGGAYGFGSGQGDVVERSPNALLGAAGGAVIGGAAPPVANALATRVAAPAVNALQSVGRFAGRQIGRAGEAAGVPGATALVERASPNALQTGINRFAARSPQDMNALNANAERFRSQEIQPTFADAVNDGGRGTMRALATRQTPARQSAREFADSRATGLQDRISTQARRNVSADPRQPAEIRTEITGRRNAQADQQFGAVRGEVITPDEAVVSALRAPATRTAIEDAASEAANFGDIETANLLRNLTPDALDNPSGVQITVGMADRLARTLNGRGEAASRSGNNTQAASLFSLAERLRGTARQQVPAYDEALRGYAQDSGLAAATDLGEQFTRMEADQFAAQAARLSPEERQVAQAAARRAIERDAGTQGAAPGVAQRLAGGREQGARSAALLDNPEQMQTAMRTELEALRNAQAVSPSQGSQTSMNLQDAGNAAGIIGGVAQAARGDIGGVVARIANGIKSRGFSDQEAEALVQAAIDPQQTDRIISMLAQRMSRREARNLARTIRYQVTTSLQSGQQN